MHHLKITSTTSSSDSKAKVKKPGISICSLCSTAFTRSFYPGRSHFHRKEQEKAALCKIFQFLRVPRKEAETLLKKSTTASYCLTCGRSFDGIIQLQEEIERLRLLVKWKVERIGRRLVKNADAGVGSRGADAGETLMMKPKILKYLAGAPSNPSVRLTRMEPGMLARFLNSARSRETESEDDDDDIEVIEIVTSPTKDTSKGTSIGRGEKGLKNGGGESTKTSQPKLSRSGNSSSVDEGSSVSSGDRKEAKAKLNRSIVEKEAPKITSQEGHKSQKQSINTSGSKLKGVQSKNKVNVENTHELLTNGKSSDLKKPSHSKKKQADAQKANKVDSKTPSKSPLPNGTVKDQRKPIYDSVYDTDSDSDSDDDLFEEIMVTTIRKKKLNPCPNGISKSSAHSSKSLRKSSTDQKKPSQALKRNGSSDADLNNSSQSPSKTNSKLHRTDEWSVTAALKDKSLEQYLEKTVKVKPSPMKTSPMKTSESKDGSKASLMENSSKPAKKTLPESDDDLFVPVSPGKKSRAAKKRHSQSSPLKTARKCKTAKGSPSQIKPDKQTDDETETLKERLAPPEVTLMIATNQSCSEVTPESSTVELRSRSKLRAKKSANTAVPPAEFDRTDETASEVLSTLVDNTVHDEKSRKGSIRKSTKPISYPTEEIICDPVDDTATVPTTESNLPSETAIDIEACEKVTEVTTPDKKSRRVSKSGSTGAKLINSPAKEVTCHSDQDTTAPVLTDSGLVFTSTLSLISFPILTTICSITGQTTSNASEKPLEVPVTPQDDKPRRISTRTSNKTKLISNSTREITCASELNDTATTVPTMNSNETGIIEASKTVTEDVNTKKTCRVSKRSAKSKPTDNSATETACDSDDDLFVEIPNKPKRSSRKRRIEGSKSTENKLPVTPPRCINDEGTVQSNEDFKDFSTPFMELIEISPVKDDAARSETLCEELNDPLEGIGESSETQAVVITDFTSRESTLVCEYCGLQFIDISMDDEQLKLHLKQHILMCHTETDLKPIVLNDGSVVYVHVPVDDEDEIDSEIPPETPLEDDILNEIVVTVTENVPLKKRRRVSKVKKSPKKKQPKLKLPVCRRKGTPMLRSLIAESLRNAEEAELDLNEELQDSTVESTTTSNHIESPISTQSKPLKITPGDSRFPYNKPPQDSTLIESAHTDHNYSIQCNMSSYCISGFLSNFSSQNSAVGPKPNPEESYQNPSSKTSISPWPCIDLMCEVCDFLAENAEMKILHMQMEHFYCDICIMPLNLSFEDYLTHKLTHKNVEEQQTSLQSRMDLPQAIRECLISHHDAGPEQFTFSNCLLGEVMYLIEAQVPAISVGSFVVEIERRKLGCGICGGFIKIGNHLDTAEIVRAMRQLKDHYTLTHFSRLYFCYICGQHFSIRNHLDGHYSDAHRHNYFPCPECQKPHCSQDLLAQHRKTHFKKRKPHTHK